MSRDRAPPPGTLAIPRPRGIYKATLKSYTQDGTISRELQEKIVNFQRKQLKVEKEINPESVYDFTILRALNDERKKTGQ
jgi:hypothetical protein